MQFFFVLLINTFEPQKNNDNCKPFEYVTSENGYLHFVSRVRTAGHVRTLPTLGTE